MRLKDDRERNNSQRKLNELLRLIEKKERSSMRSAAYEMSLESMKVMANRLRAEVEEYERAHQVS
ncbi:MAG: hypothetical protein ABSH08_14580 [Tepidisphaeraceae bacterium]|jgi:hypothetical protein